MKQPLIAVLLNRALVPLVAIMISSSWTTVGCDAFFVTKHELIATAGTGAGTGAGTTCTRDYNKQRLISFKASSYATTMHASTAAATTTTTTATPEFSGGFDSDRMDALTQRGILETNLMQGNVGILGEMSQTSNNDNHKKKKKKNKKKKGPSTAMVVRQLNQEGVVRLDGILSPSTAATLREEILKRRDDAYAAISSSSSSSSGVKEDWRQYFADVLLKTNRCDLLLPFEGNKSLQTAMHEILVSSNKLPSMLQTAMGGDDATLYELSALISEPGSPRQPVHPDNPHQQHSPLYTVFIALQNITHHMGPTIFLPRTNTEEAHDQYNNIPQRDAFLESSPSVAALLNAGDASLFDSRTMHCGGANDELEGSTRVLLYMSFRNPRATEPIGNVGSILPDVERMTIRELRRKLAANIAQRDEKKEEDDITPTDELRLLAERGDALAQLKLGISYYVGENSLETDHVEAVRWFERASALGNAHAQFNLGCCYSLGVGVSQPDLDRAIQLFKLAVEQDHPGAKEALDEASEQKKKDLQSS